MLFGKGLILISTVFHSHKQKVQGILFLKQNWGISFKPLRIAQFIL